ncbi:hypothetical protein B0H16DRAFT_1897379 [Mycena metata]|uniref:Uncharacterized protein n=1 Tax=Mycena metata TaxID=1033252 RepID=A0AAD7MIE4_9AGAR|nr:hypothetical protein B0H16DRAFT_1897379 [Mycena metata]
MFYILSTWTSLCSEDLKDSIPQRKRPPNGYKLACTGENAAYVAQGTFSRTGFTRSFLFDLHLRRANLAAADVENTQNAGDDDMRESAPTQALGTSVPYLHLVRDGRRGVGGGLKPSLLVYLHFVLAVPVSIRAQQPLRNPAIAPTQVRCSDDMDSACASVAVTRHRHPRIVRCVGRCNRVRASSLPASSV